ncbi:MAG TPA: hypothetical protein DEG55_00730 [Acidaminococcaceae bacterium]|nr:hypothetical protein [Acidaminococcaceae bacterium]
MRKIIMAVIVSVSMVLGVAAITGNTAQAQQTAAAVQSEGKAIDTQAAVVQPDSKTADAQAADVQSNSKTAGTEAADTATAEAETKYPVTEPVAGREDVVAFTDAGNGFRVLIPAELQLYPLGVNPVAVLRGENKEKGLRLAIDASAIDSRGPLMPFQVDAFREDFLRLVKSSVKDSANDKKILTSGEVELAGQKAVHVVSTTLTTDGKRRLLRDEYVFVTQNRMFVVMYMMDETRYPEYKERIPEWMNSVEISQVWKKINVPGTSLATEVPASCISLKDPSEVSMSMEVYGNESIMVGLVSYPGAQFAFLPPSLDSLQQAEQTAVLEGLKQKLAADTKGEATGYRGEFITVGGRSCVKGSYEVNGSKNESYTFVRDGQVIELGFVYKPENEKAVRPVITRAIENLQI